MNGLLTRFQNQNESESNFWIIADAIKQFYAKHNELPLPGAVPDMKAQSSVYVQLQNIYKSKARQDVAEVLQIVRSHPRGSEIDEAEVETFCKNAAFIKLIHGPNSSTTGLQAIAGRLMLAFTVFLLTFQKPRSSRTMNRPS
jgi:NEDD8-activating enzyme E1 regulatory subunit